MRQSRGEPNPILVLFRRSANSPRQASWVHVYCEARDCHHSAPLKLADAAARYGEEASSDVLRTKTRCTTCGAIGATIRLPSWVDSTTGHAPFPDTTSR